MVAMVEVLHERVDAVVGVLATFLCEMEIQGGGFDAGVSHVALDDAEVDAGLQEMGGVGVSQGMKGDAAFGGAGLEFGVSESALRGGLCHGGVGTMGLVSAPRP